MRSAHLTGLGIIFAGLFGGVAEGAIAYRYWTGKLTSSEWDKTGSVGGKNYSNWSLQSYVASVYSPMLPNIPVAEHVAVFASDNGGDRQAVSIVNGAVEVAGVLFNDAATKKFTISGSSTNKLMIRYYATRADFGLIVTAGSTAHEILAPVTLLTTQTWSIAAPDVANDNTLTVGGALGGNYPLTKVGGGTLVLKAAATDFNPRYENSVLVNEGTLRVENATGSATGPGQVKVNAGGTLAGNGQVAALQVQGTLAPGNGVGLLRSAAQGWLDGATLAIDLLNMPSDGVAGTGWDALSATGAVDFGISGQFTIDLRSMSGTTTAGLLNGFDPFAATSWPILTATQLTNFDVERFSVDPGAFQNDLEGGAFSVHADGQTLYLDFTPIPEPSGIGWMPAGMVALTTRRRRAAGSRTDASGGL